MKITPCDQEEVLGKITTDKFSLPSSSSSNTKKMAKEECAASSSSDDNANDVVVVDGRIIHNMTSSDSQPSLIDSSSSDQECSYSNNHNNTYSTPPSKNSRANNNCNRGSSSCSRRDNDDSGGSVTPPFSAESSSNSSSQKLSPCSLPPRKFSTAIVSGDPKAKGHGLIKNRPTKMIMTPMRTKSTGLGGGVCGIRSSVVGGKPMMKLNKQLSGSVGISHTSMRRSISVPIDDRYAGFVSQPQPLQPNFWSDPPAEKFHVRGPNYLNDRQKIFSDASVFRLLAVDLVKTDQPILTGLCSHPNERVQRALRREQETGAKELPEFVFAVNLVVPYDPYFHWVAYYGYDDVEQLQDESTPLGRLCRPFFFGKSDKFRDNTFKLIPRIVEGNFIVRKAVGSKPSILGRKLKQHYIRNERFFGTLFENHFFFAVVALRRRNACSTT